MAFLSKTFNESALEDVRRELDAFFAVNPTFTPIDLAMPTTGTSFYAILIYETP
jgi:hypothetical protein